MKKTKIYLLAFLVVAFISSIYFVGCKNENELVETSNQQINKSIAQKVDQARVEMFKNEFLSELKFAHERAKELIKRKIEEKIKKEIKRLHR